MSDVDEWIDATVREVFDVPAAPTGDECLAVSAGGSSAASSRFASWAERVEQAIDDASVRGDVDVLPIRLTDEEAAEASCAPLDAAALFDAYLDERLADIEAAGFEVVAGPGDALPDVLPPGSVLVTRALGEGRLAPTSVLRDGRLLDEREVALVRVDDPRPGFYVEVSDPVARRRYGREVFARRIADPSRTLDADRLVLRPLAAQAEAAETNEPAVLLRSAPPVLAGPVLRRASRREVFVWFATQGPLSDFRAAVYGPPGGGELARAGAGDVRSVQVGIRLHVHLVRILAPEQGFPAGQLLSYELFLGERPVSAMKAGLGLSETGGRPSFMLQSSASASAQRESVASTFLHASCRKLHGRGGDALALADTLLASSRPQALFLTGDQIYADDVDPGVLSWCSRLGEYLIGPEHVVGVSPAELDGPRGALMGALGFTSGEAEHHAVRLGEFVALYLMAWDEGLWPAGLERQRAGVDRVRRVLANFPVYMTFDDHEVTDDWNLDRAQNQSMLHPEERGSRREQGESARQIVTNALTAFWLFQGWGNDPHRFGPDRFPRTREWLRDPSNRRSAADARVELLGPNDQRSLHPRTQDWTFVAPTWPPVLALDTRTQRELRDAGGGPGLQSRAQLTQLRGFIAAEPFAEAFRQGLPLVLVSPAPLLGIEIVEMLQRVASTVSGGHAAAPLDNEPWINGVNGRYRDMLRFLTESAAPYCVVLSGDVHYAYTLVANVQVRGRSKRVVQLTSSPAKNADWKASGLASAFNALGDVVSGTANPYAPLASQLMARFGDRILAALPADARGLAASLLTRTLAELLALLMPREASRLLTQRRHGWVRANASLAHRGLTFARALLAQNGRARAEMILTSSAPVLLPPDLARQYDLSNPDWTEVRLHCQTSARRYLIPETNIGEIYIRGSEVRHILHGLRSGRAFQESVRIRNATREPARDTHSEPVVHDELAGRAHAY